ncbi:MAG: GxxExxY protein [Planctomycetota bacterium]|jgi:GxxExxY protein
MRIDSPLPEDLEDLIQKVIGAAIEVLKNLGPGFLESVYERALCHELEIQNIRFERQKEISIEYKGLEIAGHRIDILIGERLILELKAVEEIAPIHEAQLLSYLKSTELRAGLIINFNVRKLKDGIRRMVN